MNNILKKSITKSSICQISKKRLSKSCVENCWTNSITKSAQNAYMYVGYWRVPAVLRGEWFGMLGERESCWKQREREVVEMSSVASSVNTLPNQCNNFPQELAEA